MLTALTSTPRWRLGPFFWDLSPQSEHLRALLSANAAGKQPSPNIWTNAITFVGAFCSIGAHGQSASRPRGKGNRAIFTAALRAHVLAFSCSFLARESSLLTAALSPAILIRSWLKRFCSCQSLLWDCSSNARSACSLEYTAAVSLLCLSASRIARSTWLACCRAASVSALSLSSALRSFLIASRSAARALRSRSRSAAWSSRARRAFACASMDSLNCCSLARMSAQVASPASTAILRSLSRAARCWAKILCCDSNAASFCCSLRFHSRLSVSHIKRSSRSF
mmetsp:Transcript_12739/g.32551  ORF Transcript_12739/g.32551 Transcript_12739/m.32551 type:complete len:282 (-) Transcript_12739:394-1239(-)